MTRRGLGERLLGNEQEDIGFLLVAGVAVQNQPARGKAEAFPGPSRKRIGGSLGNSRRNPSTSSPTVVEGGQETDQEDAAQFAPVPDGLVEQTEDSGVVVGRGVTGRLPEAADGAAA